MSKPTIVPPLRVLRKMAEAGLIELHPHTGEKVSHWSGNTVTAMYVEGVCDGVKQPFRFRGRQYREKYGSGCFYPYIVDIGAAKMHGIDLDAPQIS